MRSIFRPLRISITLLAVAVAGSIALPLPGCLGILGDYEIDPTFNANGDPVEADRTPCTSETQATDCKSNEECYTSFCVQRCSTESQCGEAGYYECSSTCSVRLGNSCAVSGMCGTGTCIETDANLNTVAKYCTRSCVSEPCPSGYLCVDYYCMTNSSM